MKEFLIMLNDVIIKLDAREKISADILEIMNDKYQSLTENEKEKSRQILIDLFVDNYFARIFFFSFFLEIFRDKRWLFVIRETLMTKKYPLWGRINDLKQYMRFSFMNPSFYEEDKEYGNHMELYQNILNELYDKMEIDIDYIPYAERSKKVVLIVSQLLYNTSHAPTKKLKYIYKCYERMGYQVRCVVCFYQGIEGNWGAKTMYNNISNQMGEFQIDFDGYQLEGYNLVLRESDYISTLEKAVYSIWNEKPEFVLEIGDQTLLAGLCSRFTTLVTMGCTSNLAISNAPIIATPVSFPEEEWNRKKQILDRDQLLVEVKHNIDELDMKNECITYKKATFGISESSFVIIIAGTRLDEEIKDAFIEIMYQILEMDEHFVIAVIGDCIKLQQRIVKDKKENRIIFLGVQKAFKETIAIGDIFLNPPRLGGGSGGYFAIMEEVPVITLDHCDVQGNVGMDFVCKSIENMPALVWKYFKDEEFMSKQKENCRKIIQERVNVDGMKSFQMLTHTVKQYTLQREENENASI